MANENLLSSTDQLELEAAEQRRRLASSVDDLKYQVRDTLDVKKNAREHFGPAAGGAAVLGLLLGYLFAGSFV